MDRHSTETENCENCKYGLKYNENGCYDRWYEMNGIVDKKFKEHEDLINCWEQEEN